MQTHQLTEAEYRTTGEVWSDLHHLLIPGSQGGIRKAINIDAVKTSITNILSTSPMQRVMRPTFASKLKFMVFEPIDEGRVNNIATEIQRVIEAWDSRIILNSVNFDADSDRNFAAIKISFSVRGYQNVYTHTVEITAGA